MSDTPHDPHQAYPVIDGPLTGEACAHDRATFEVFVFPRPSWMAHLRTPRATDTTVAGYVRYWLHEGADGCSVWSCVRPVDTVTRNA